MREYNTRLENPLVAICMATYNPPLDMFTRQIDSIIKQNHSNWICIINDDFSEKPIFEKMKKIVSKDSRFLVYRNSTNLGFYHNFEQCLMKVPENVEYVAFSDQDDFWYPDKLSTCISEFDKETTLVYSDMKLVDENGVVISDTYWTSRDNNYEDLALLLFANTVTGAASMFRKSLLEAVLPFPSKVGDSYHDWWVACVALANGNIRYINKPLYDYVQHGKNVLGHFTQKHTNFIKQISSSGLVSFVFNNHNVFVNDFIRIVLAAKTLKERDDGISPDKLRIINEIANYENSISKLFVRYIKSKFRGPTVTLGAEGRLLQSYIVTNLYKRYVGLNKNRYVRPEMQKEVVQTRDLSVEISAITQKISPLNLVVSPDAKPMINMVIPTIDFNYFFGGYIGKFNFAKQLSAHGYDVRVIIVDWCDFNASFWRNEIRKYQGLEDFFDKVEIFYAFDRNRPLEISKDDIFVATTWWTAHIANDALKYVDAKKFLYFIQEYEPFTFPHGTYHALSQETYTFPHYAIFSTEFLREFFRNNKIGVFSKGQLEGEKNSVSFNNPIVKFEINDQRLDNRRKKRVLFYARPEQHASRNMFELGVIALSRAIENEFFEPNEWEFHGIGSVEHFRNIKLSKNHELKIIPRVSLDEYKKILPNYDIGLSLMLTPHPNLLTLDMAAAGMIVVTNSYENKNQETLSKISSNIIAAEPTISGIEQALLDASKLVDNHKFRMNGAKVNWPSRWEDAFIDIAWDRLSDLVK